MQSATAWRRHKESTPRRGTSPARPPPDSIERLSPDPDHSRPSTPPTLHFISHSNSAKRQHASNSVQGLGLPQNFFPERSLSHPDYMYLDSNGSAHLGAKLRSPKHSSYYDHTTTALRSPSANVSSLQYRSSKGKGHTRSGSTIDDLANIAIATSPQFNNFNSVFSGSSPTLNNNSRPSTSYVNGYSQESSDRPAKRIKSDRWFAHDISVKEERPRTSSAHHSDIKPEDVELLLNLKNAFRAPLQSGAPIAQAQFPQREPDVRTTEVYPQPVPPDPEERVSDIKHVSAGDHETGSPVAPAENDVAAPADDIPATDDQALPNQSAPDQSQGNEVTKREASEEPVYHPENDRPPPIQTATGTVEHEIEDVATPAPTKKQRRIAPTRVAEWCSACRNTQYAETQEGSKIDWIECVGCKRWLHYPCAGFQNAQDVKKVDKFFCKECEPVHGETTYVRTSSRARTAPDYAALNEGVTKSSDEDTMHHYIPKFKKKELSWRRDDFARVRPALLTEEWWENMDGMKRPFVVPACWNPKFGTYPADSEQPEDPTDLPSQSERPDAEKKKIDGYVKYDSNRKTVEKAKQPWDLATEADADEVHEKAVIDLNQDFLGMVMPHDLTVRKVAELYGPNEPVPVIDVKSQATKGKFTLRQWANYYESPEGQPVRNVISLEISQSRLGRLIRRPKVVQDIDLEDQVWDFDSRSAINKKSVAYYCLMSVADSYTDFHIDFGGSSVYYHILKGMKTFFFIPPEERYLKKYEEWCNSADQSQTWLGDLCNGNVTRVDLHPGDTAFIPAGWIHSVWTPKDSLVIGGNFLTRYDLDLQIKVAQIEKDTDVAAPYRYPFFQKVMWYTLIKYLEDDPVPESVIRDFLDDSEYRYLRANPIWAEKDVLPDHEPEDGDFNARNYSKSELRGLPALRDYLYRTARIHADLPVEKIDKKKIDAVKRSIPKGHGDPMQLICLFAVWCAWKIGNITVPDWVHSDLTYPSAVGKAVEDTKKVERVRIPPERASTRKRNINSPAPDPVPQLPETEESSGSPAPSRSGMARIACEVCRKKKQACRHLPGAKLEETVQQTLEKTRNYPNVTIDIAKLASASPVVASVERAPTHTPQRTNSTVAPVPHPTAHQGSPEVSTTTDLAQAALARMSSQPPETNGITVNNTTTPGSAKKGRSKACDECRKSKRRCVHDVNGRVDPVKAAEPSKPRGSSSSKRPARISDEHQAKRNRPENDGEPQYPVFMTDHDLDAMIDPALMAPIDPMLGVSYDPNMPVTDVNAFSTPPQALSTENSFSMTRGLSHEINPLLDPALMEQQPFDPTMNPFESAQGPNESDEIMTEAPQNKMSKLPQLGLITVSTPDVDKSFSPITAETSSAEIALRSGGEEDTISIPQQTSAPDEPLTQDTNMNGVAHDDPVDETKPQIDHRRHSSNATGVSPKQEVMSYSSGRRSSSQTSGNTHVAASVEQSQSAARTGPEGDVPDNHGDIVPKQDFMATPIIKEEIADTVEHTPMHMRRASTAASSVSDVNADEEYARQLQMEEMGLRRRTSVRAP